jgi:cobalt-zinc-cadmium efflux system outer membrane protein
LAQARALVEQARCTLAREMAGRTPNLDLELSLQHDFSTGDTLTGVQAGMPIPVFDRNQGNICRAEGELRSAVAAVRRIELRLQQKLATAFERYANARQETEQYRASILPNARTSLELVQSGYRQGEISYLVLLNAQRTYCEANRVYLEATRQLRTSQAEIETLLLRGGLEDLPGPGG